MENKIVYNEACLIKLGDELEELAKKYNEELQSDAPSVAKLASYDANFKELEADYYDVKQRLIFENCEKADKPMYAAILKHSFPIKRHKLVNEGEEEHKIKVCRIVDIVRPLDLMAFDTYMTTRTGSCASVNASWPHMVTKLAMLLTAEVAGNLGINPKEINDSYAMSEIARKIDMGGTPTSNTALLKMVQSIIDSIIYEKNEATGVNIYKASSHDVAYLREIFSKKGKAELSVACAKPSFLRGIIADIGYRIVSNKVYSVEFKKSKTDEPMDVKNSKTDEAVDANKPETNEAVDAKKPEKKPTKKSAKKSA